MSKVVPFSRSAAYLYQRAVINRREGHLLDALELTRRAPARTAVHAMTIRPRPAPPVLSATA